MSDSGEIAKLFQPLTETLGKLLGPLSEEVGLDLRDRYKAFRKRNVTTVIEGAVKYLDNAGKPVNPVPPRLLLPILESASVEDNTTLQDMWAGLLASASDEADAMSPSFIETLKALTPFEARALRHCYDSTAGSSFVYGLGREWVAQGQLAHTLDIPEEVSARILESFERLGLTKRDYDLQEHPPAIHTSGGVSFVAEVGIDSQEIVYSLDFTRYAERFMQACSGPVPKRTS